MCKDLLKFNKRSSSAFSVYALNPQVIPTGVQTLINMGTGINFDLLNEFNGVAYNFSPQRAGYYKFYATSGILNLGVNDSIEFWIQLNGVNIAYMSKTTPIIQNYFIQVLCVAHVVPTDIVEVYISHNVGANRNLMNGVLFSRFNGFRYR